MSAFLLLAGAVCASGSPYVAVVHRSNPVEDIRLSHLKSLFTGGVRTWPNQKRVILVQRDPESPAHRFVLDNLLMTTSRGLKRHLSAIEFGGAGPLPLKTLNSDRAACKYVFNVPGSIAILEAAALVDSDCAARVKVVRIDGRLPGETGYRLE